MNKQDIEQWLYKNNMEDTAYVFTCKPYEEGAQSLSKIILDCFNELAPKIKADAVRGIRQNVPMTNNGIEGFYSYLDIIDYSNKLEGGE